MDPPRDTIWTIGHSTRKLVGFVDLLEAHGIDLLVDVRRHPGSRLHPQYNREALAAELGLNDIGYRHMPDLGGRRKPRPDSHNTAWRSESFRGYADYMETPEFVAAAEELIRLARERPTAIMCSEAVWWRCHRGLISDYLKIRGFEVLHIGEGAKAEGHPWTSAARIVDGKLCYAGDGLFEQR